MNESLAAVLLMKHRTALFGYILACVRNHHDAEDILQDVCLAVTCSIHQLEQPQGFLPWAREIARLRVLEHFRTSKRVRVVEPDQLVRLAEAADRVEQRHAGEQRYAALLACLASLPPRSQKLIKLRYEDNRRPLESVADEFGCTLQAVHGLLKRIRLSLHDCVTRRLVREARE